MEKKNNRVRRDKKTYIPKGLRDGTAWQTKVDGTKHGAMMLLHPEWVSNPAIVGRTMSA